MAIEFSCPFCKAIIRVPDNAGGGKGRCPKCATRISVPKTSTVKPAVVPQSNAEPFVLSAAEGPPRSEPKPRLPTNLPAAATVAPVVVEFDPAELTRPRLGELPIDRTATTGAVVTRLKKRNSGNQSWIVGGIIGLGLLALAGYFGFSVLLAEKLSGELIAETAATLDLPPALIDKNQFKLPPADVTALLETLQQNPVPLNSHSMQIQLAGTEKGLQISLAAGGQAAFYRVNLSGNAAVEKYLSQHLSQLEAQRILDIDQAATEFLVQYEKVLSKKSPPESITVFRDSLALTLLVGGLGHELVAVHGRGLYRCAYQDRSGGLYYLLPPGLTEFQLIGRKHVDGKTAVPAEFRVQVQGGIAPRKSADEKSPAKSSQSSQPPLENGEKVSSDGDEMIPGKK